MEKIKIGINGFGRIGRLALRARLRGRLNGHAVRVPLATGSLTDCVFEVERNTTVDEVNALLKTASETYLKNILGYANRTAELVRLVGAAN
jgi:glyceraldehyde-3-phosphate dehydrogenase/erythrose-4-phosphate dehydrogenase